MLQTSEHPSVTGKRALEDASGVLQGCAVTIGVVGASGVASASGVAAASSVVADPAERAARRQRGLRTVRHAVLVSIPDNNLRRFLASADNARDWRGAESLLLVPMALPGQNTPASGIYTLVITFPESTERSYRRWTTIPPPMLNATRVHEMQRMPGAVTVQLSDVPLEAFPHPAELLATRRRLEQELQRISKVEKEMSQLTAAGVTQVGRDWFEPDESGAGMCVASVASVRASLTPELELIGRHFLSKPRWFERARLLARIPFDSPQRVVCVFDSDEAQEELRDLLGACRMERWNGRAEMWPRALAHEFVVVDVSGEVALGFLGDIIRARALVWIDRTPHAPQAATQMASQMASACWQAPSSLPSESATSAAWVTEGCVDLDAVCA